MERMNRVLLTFVTRKVVLREATKATSASVLQYYCVVGPGRRLAAD